MKSASYYQRSGIQRVLYAFRWSYQGLSTAFRTETAFRQELLIAIPLLAPIVYLDLSASERAILFGSISLVLIVEILNSALEALADRISTDYDIQLGKVKDYGSAAVFLAIGTALFSWVCILLDHAG